MKYSTYLFIVVLFSILSCRKEEQPILRHPRGESSTSFTDLGTDYRYQAFFDLGTNSWQQKKLRTSWDLAFESKSSGYHVLLNSSCLMAVWKVENIDFQNLIDTTGAVWSWDAASGNLDSTAIGDWINSSAVYLVDCGMDYLGNHRGFKKIQLQEVTSNGYSFITANLDGTDYHQVNIEKDEVYNFQYFSFQNNSTELIAPPKDEWDLEFTTYTHYFEEEEMAYLVTGVLLNRSGVEVAEITNIPFDDIEIDLLTNITFSNAVNTIGYNWKYYDFSSGIYVVNPSINYVIKTTEGKVFKLHFIDFYNDAGEKGTPKFEFKEL